MGRKLKNLSEQFKTLIIDENEVFVRECPECGLQIHYSGKSKRWNVQLAEKNKSKCNKCQNKNQVPWNVGIPMKEESKIKSSKNKVGKCFQSENYKNWLKENSPFKGKGKDSIVIKKILEKENITYEEYLMSYKHFKDYKKKVYLITYQQPIHILKNSDKIRGRSGNYGVYQLDHIVSIKEGYDKKISPEIIGNINNLQFIPWEENLKKSKEYKKINN